MKPLTIEELKSLEVGDWVWLIDTNSGNGTYAQLYCVGKDMLQFSTALFNLPPHLYSDYGIAWLAYKNKEQAEAKGEIVELPCIREVKNADSVRYNIYFIRTTFPDIGAIDFYTVKDKSQAERCLAELKDEDDEPSLLPYLGDVFAELQGKE